MGNDHSKTAASELPEEIIQHIQSLIISERDGDERDAARTSLLSKSWHGAWTTHPNLSFDQSMFWNRMDEFPIFTKKTIQRYEDLIPNIKSFKLWMSMKGNDYPDLARELILKAIKLGATDLTIQISLAGVMTRSRFVLPDEVLQSETLARLFLLLGQVDHQKWCKEVILPNLKSLHLCYTTIYGDGDLIRDLILGCPSIEELTLIDLKSSSPFPFDAMIKLHKLKYLKLERLDFNDSLCKHDLWPQLPCLKELVIDDDKSDYKWDDLRICSPSLERITIIIDRFKAVMNAEFDVPNIRYFKFKGHYVPSLKFKTTTTREWESEIHVRFSPYMPSAAWLSSLKQLVKMLSPSRVSLTMHITATHDDGDGYVGDGLAVPVVENLTIQGFGLNGAFLDALLWTCRPNFINTEKRYAEMVLDLKVFELKKKTVLDPCRETMYIWGKKRNSSRPKFETISKIIEYLQAFLPWRSL
ncbi:putative F-box/LRR-repeat protein At3g18150 [Salvia miltiorrhiza]|uniref:putative F-box/LRR-repeat protein At3g18150 n=1 Tax=Salvia miltiorrhiza TaxID=226208 RepID=UPI0025AD688A|nr:putative F-box/LRR-repeat protein At3g18150 [Salvia miltiorrhiza]